MRRSVWGYILGHARAAIEKPALFSTGECEKTNDREGPARAAALSLLLTFHPSPPFALPSACHFLHFCLSSSPSAAQCVITEMATLSLSSLPLLRFRFSRPRKSKLKVQEETQMSRRLPV